jgi:hypothetical protein
MPCEKHLMEYFYVYDMYGLNNSNPLSNVHTAANIIGVQEFEVNCYNC